MILFKEIIKCLPVIERSLSRSIMMKFLNSSYEDLSDFHFNIGLWIRNNLLKDSGEPDCLYRMFRDIGITQSDDMSTIITELFYIYMKS